MRFFERIAATNERALTKPALRGVPPRRAAAALVRGIAEGYKRHRRLIRALLLYARTHPDPEFQARAAALNAHAFGQMQRLLASRIATAGTRRSRTVPFAIAAVATILRDQIVFDEDAVNLGLTGEELVTEATRLLSMYLGL
jgi:hypothetical protein